MALGPLTLDVNSGVAGRDFQATISGQSSGSTIEVVGYDGTPGFSTSNGRVYFSKLPAQNPVTLVLRETLVGTGTRDSRISIAVDGIPLGAAGLSSALSGLGVGPSPVANSSNIAVTRAVAKLLRASDGSYTSVAQNTPAILDGAVVAEPRSFQLMSNPAASGLVAGSPGTLPNNVTVTATGLTRTLTAVTTESGITYWRVRLQGTVTATCFINLDGFLSPEPGTSFAPGQRYVASVFIRLAAGSFSGFTDCFLRLSENDASGTDLSAVSGYNILGATQFPAPTVGGPFVRYWVPRTLTNSAVAKLRPAIRLGITSGATIDITLDIGNPQLEARPVGGAPTSPMLTALTERKETVVVGGLPTGTYDVLVTGPENERWLTAQSVSGYLTVPIIERYTRPDRITSIRVYPSGLSSEQKTSAALAANPISFVDATTLFASQPQSIYGIGPLGFAIADDNSMVSSYAVQKASGRNLWAMETRAGEATGGHNGRAEINTPGVVPDNPIPVGTDFWISYCVKICKPLATDVNLFMISGQLHGSPDAGDVGLPPPFSVYFAGSTINLNVKWDTNPVQTSTTNTHSVNYYSAPFNDVGIWVPIVLHVRQSQTNTGVLEAWIKGQQVCSVSNINMGYNDAVPARWQFGVYDDPSYPDMRIEYGNVEFSTSSLLDRVANPLPLPY